jgi:CRISPR-associated protein Cmr1
MAGADVQKPELRSPSIKGVLRFWWRAMTYSDSPDNSFEELLQKEGESFGSTKKGVGRSKVSLVVRRNSRLETGSNVKDDYALSWRSENNRTLTGKDAGIGYLLYSVIVFGRGRKFFRHGQKFSVELKSHDPDTLKQACAAFWALVYFGGLGARSRRGGGNIGTTGVHGDLDVLKDGNEALEFIVKGSSSEEVKKWLVDNYSRAISIVNGGILTTPVTTYSSITDLRFILSKDSFQDWKGALNAIGSTFSKYRTTNKMDTFGTAAFGLPAKHVKTDNEMFERRASPLLIKLVKVESKYYWLVLWLSGEFLPQNVDLQNKGDRRKKSAPNYGKIAQFWDQVALDGVKYEP